MIKGIIFDMDGVLVKTIHIAEKIARYKLKEHGINITKKDIMHLSGFSWKEFLEYIYKSRKINKISGIYEDILKEYDRVLHDEVILYRGSKNTLKSLSKEYRLALVSGSTKKSIYTNLKKFGLLAYFEVIISAEEMKRGKPAPDLYLAAAKILNLKPEECIGIEDSILGISSVKNANMRCIAITNTVPKPKLAQADIIITDLKEIKSVLKRIEKK